jgi:hypothetical protein
MAGQSALLSPLPDTGPLERLRAGGQIVEAAANLDESPDPLVLPAGWVSASATLTRLRESER